ncbi:MAG: acyl-CoA carboxylase subunit beta [Firmicutes bacterium]|nr:acyl-CoA carboxylase subunit beta [Bacillota bacterium]
MQERRRQVLSGGGEKEDKGTARERIESLLDEGSFIELGTFVQGELNDAAQEIRNPGEGVITGSGTIDGRQVYLYAQDFTVAGGSMGAMHAKKICRVFDLAGQNGVPLIGLIDSAGGRVDEGIDVLDGYGSVLFRHALYSGVIPQISVVLGPCAGTAAFLPALSDFVFMVEEAGSMFVNGPQVTEAVTGESITLEELGGAKGHSASGAVHFFAENEVNSLNGVRALMSYLPLNNVDDPPVLESKEPELDPEALLRIIPNGGASFDVREVIRHFVDGGSFFEVQQRYAQNGVTGLARLGGVAVGIVANQPLEKGGFLDIDVSDKFARFIRFCDSFNVPLVTLVDVPGFLPGVEQEQGGLARHGAKLFYAYAEAAVPKFTLVLRKAYGGASVAMGSRSLGADLCLAWPTAEIAVLAPEGAVEIVDQGELAGERDPQKLQELACRYRERFANPYIAAGRGWIDEVIDPRQTREYLLRALQIAGNKRVQRPPRKHGNMPL